MLLAVIFMRLASIPGGKRSWTIRRCRWWPTARFWPGSSGWYASLSLQTVFGLRGAGLWTRTAAVAAGLVGLLYGYTQFLFWSTVIAVRLS